MPGESRTGGVARSWDAEYTAGRYRHDPPVGFVDVILRAVGNAGLRGAAGLYVGCGNGRNFLPLLHGGLDLIGLDVSAAALAQLAERAPDHRHRLVHGDAHDLPADATWPVVVGIQVFQHGDRAKAHANLAAPLRVAAGGLFCVRVNAVGTDIAFAHDVVEQAPDGGFTVAYRHGPKRGLAVHFYTAEELDMLIGHRFTAVVRASCTERGGIPQQPANGPSGKASGNVACTSLLESDGTACVS